LREIVTNNNHGSAGVSDPPDEVKHAFGLSYAEVGCRLIHKNCAGGPHSSPGHSSALLLPPRKGKYLRRRPDLNTEPCHGLTGETVHLWFVEDPKLSQETWPEKFSHEEDVSGGGQIGREGQVLIDRLDPGCARILWP